MAPILPSAGHKGHKPLGISWMLIHATHSNLVSISASEFGCSLLTQDAELGCGGNELPRLGFVGSADVHPGVMGLAGRNEQIRPAQHNHICGNGLSICRKKHKCTNVGESPRLPFMRACKQCQDRSWGVEGPPNPKPQPKGGFLLGHSSVLDSQLKPTLPQGLV